MAKKDGDENNGFYSCEWRNHSNRRSYQKTSNKTGERNMSIDELERDGWEIIDTFADTDLIVARDDKRMVVDKNGEIIIVY